MKHLVTLLALVLISSGLCSSLLATIAIVPDGISGSVLLCGGQPADNILNAWVVLAGKEKSRLVLLESESKEPEPLGSRLEAELKAIGASPLLRIKSADWKQPSANTVAALNQATGVWTQASSLPEILVKSLRNVLQRNGCVASAGSSAGLLCESYQESEQTNKSGMGLLPGVCLGNRKQPGLVGLSLPDRSALLVRGRQILSAGQEPVTMTLATGAGRHGKVIKLKPESVHDLTALRKAAAGRIQPTLMVDPVVPEVKRGSLVIVGGGGMPSEITNKFIELAGGPDALIVVLPIANPESPNSAREKGFLEQAGARNVVLLTAKQPSEVNDPKNIEILRRAGGVWFGGGRQWRFVDAYEGTEAIDAFRSVLHRGGVIGGSSAGATIQGDYLCRGSPLGNMEIMFEGYEKGFAFLPGVAIDQHFAQRNRFSDMAALIKQYPQYLGIGLDESTAIVVQGQVATVLGRGEVHFYPSERQIQGQHSDHDSIKTGGRYDLKDRLVLHQSTTQKDKDAPGGWKKLFDGMTLDGWKSSGFAGSGMISIKDGAIEIEKGKVMSGITYKAGDFPKMDYEVTLEARKTDGRDFFATTTFPVGDAFCSLVVGGWSGKVVGLSNLDSMDASSNETRKDLEFKQNQWYKIRIRVSTNRIEAWIGPDKVVDQDTTDRRIGIRIECTASKPFGMSTYQTSSQIRSIQVRSLTDKEKKEIAASPPAVKE